VQEDPGRKEGDIKSVTGCDVVAVPAGGGCGVLAAPAPAQLGIGLPGGVGMVGVPCPALPRSTGPARSGGPVAGAEDGLSKSHISSHQENGVKSARASVSETMGVGELVVWRGASLVEVRLSEGGRAVSRKREVPKRQAVKTFTAGSRGRFMEALGKVDASRVPWFATLTYPDHFPMYAPEFKGHLDTFCQRIMRRWPGASVMWKLEFKRRKSGRHVGQVAPHFHLFLWGVPWSFPFIPGRRECSSLERVELPGLEPGEELWRETAWVPSGERVELPIERTEVANPGGWRFYDGFAGLEDHGPVHGADTIRGWVARNWFSVVRSGDLKHFLAGTAVEVLRTMKGALAYGSKRYAAKPVDVEFDGKPGRYWGVVGRDNVPLGKREVIELDGVQAVKVRRVIRGYRRAHTAPGKRCQLRRGDLFARGSFTVKLLCTAEFWRSCLCRLLDSG